MSQEAQTTIDFVFDKENAHEEFHFDGAADVVGKHYNKATYMVSPNDTTLDRGQVGNIGFFMIKNCDTAGVPEGPTLGGNTVGTPGTNTYKYVVVAKFNDGSISVSAEFTIASGNASLDISNYNHLAGDNVGAGGYDFYRTFSDGTPSTTGLIAANQASNALNDQGLAGDGAPVPDPVLSNKPVRIGADGSTYPDVVLAGDPPCFRRANPTDMSDIHVIADAGFNTKIEFLIVEA